VFVGVVGGRYTLKHKVGLIQILKGLYLDELVFLANRLSQNREKWGYDKRRKSSVRRAIVSNSDEHTLTKALKKSLGEEMPSGDYFPEVLQFEKDVLGPLGCLKSVENRSRYDSYTVFNIFTKYLRGTKLLEKVIDRHLVKIPKEIQALALEKKSHLYKPALVQLVLTYFSDEGICDLVNALLARKEIQIEVPGLYEDIEDQWTITRYGITKAPEEEAIENLADLIRDYHDEDDLEPELKPYSGDFKTRLLEYCIMENPETILQKLFGLPELRQIARKLGFVSENIGTTDEVTSIILLGLGFDVPPILAGSSKYLAAIEKSGRELSEAREPETRSGIMSQVFVIAERALRDLVYFYIFFLWKKRMQDLESAIEEEMPDLGTRQIRIKSLDLFIGKKFGIRKAFERLGFGDFANLIKTINNATDRSDLLGKKLLRNLGRTILLEDKQIKVLDRISPFRASFTHAKDYPGDEKCEEIHKSVFTLLNDLQRATVYPLVLRISREVSDEYGKRYAECIDENGEKWLVYTEEYLDTSYSYFFFSKTPSIAVNPIIIKKIF
jgi:hypothetical protein